jgi:hypothetical protein
MAFRLSIVRFLCQREQCIKERRWGMLNGIAAWGTEAACQKEQVEKLKANSLGP